MASNGYPLLPRYVGEVGQDAGGLRRMFFDLFAHELAVHGDGHRLRHP